MASTLEDFDRRLIRIEQALERLTVSPEHTSGVSVRSSAPEHSGPFTFFENIYAYFERHPK